MIDGKTRTHFQFDQACGIQETPQKIEIFLTEKWDSSSSKKVLVDLLELEISHETLALPGVNISDDRWNHLPSNTATFRFEEIYLLTGGEQIQAQIFPEQPGKLTFKSTSGPIITSKITIHFPSKHIKISELRFYFYTCGLTGYINPSITTGTFLDPKSDTHPVCYEYDGSDSFDEEVYTGEYWNEAHLPGFYNPVADSHPDRHYNFVVVKKTAGEFSSFDEVKQACSSFGMSLVYPYNAEANAFWLQRLQEQRAVTPGLELMIGLIHTLYSTSTGALVPSESALPLTNDVNVPNGYINFDLWDYDQVFFRLLNENKQFFMDSVTGEWSQSNSVPAGMDATFCFKTKEITATCSADLCQNTDSGEYECVCPDDGSTLVEQFGVQKCEDPSPCDVKDFCSPPAVCKSVFDSSICECPDEGISQSLSTDGLSCESIDPCDTGLHNCTHPSLKCISSGLEYSCSNTFECPCNLECLAPPCMSLLECTVPTGGVDCGGDFDCSNVGRESGLSRVQEQKESWYRCPIGKEGDCSSPDECEFDCKKLGPGWDCLIVSCQSYEECSFDCLRIEDKKCPVEQSCFRNEDCCPICSMKSGMGGSNFLTQIFRTIYIVKFTILINKNGQNQLFLYNLNFHFKF
jgi:hypothetical protein